MSDYLVITKRDKTEKDTAIRKEYVVRVERDGDHSLVYFYSNHIKRPALFEAKESFEDLMELLKDES